MGLCAGQAGGGWWAAGHNGHTQSGWSLHPALWAPRSRHFPTESASWARSAQPTAPMLASELLSTPGRAHPPPTPQPRPQRGLPLRHLGAPCSLACVSPLSTAVQGGAVSSRRGSVFSPLRSGELVWVSTVLESVS